MRKRLYLLSVLLLMVCGQTWASYNNGKPDYGTRCNGNTPTKTVIVDGVMYSLYGNQNYTYFYDYTCGTSGSGNYAVAVYAEQYDTSSELTIKSTIQDGGTTYTVVAIGEQFFWYNNSATKLTIPATVQTLETFALEDNRSNLSEIVIEDSGNMLECYRTTNGYGAFSWNGGLKKVYIGRELYAVGGTDYYYYAPFYRGDFTDLEVTLGPQVPYINRYTFYDNSIKSIKAMSQQPPNWAAYAFGGVSNTIPVYVSYKSIDAYEAHSDWKYFTNYVLDLDLCKADALNDLDAEAGQNPSAAVLAIVSDYKGQVNNATSGDEVVAWLYAGTAAIQLQKAKEAAITELNAAATDYPSEEAAGIVETYTGIINAATTIDAVNSAKEEGIQKLVEAKALQDAKAEAIAALNTEAGDSPSQAVAELRDTWIANVNNATTIAEVNTQKTNGIAAIQLQKAKEAAIAALNAEAGDTPSQAVAELRDTWIANVNNATTIAEVNTQKTNGIAAIQLQKAKEAAIAELNAEATDYPSDAAAGIVETYTGIINAATTTDAVNSAKEEGIQKLVEAKALQDAKTEAIAALNAEAGDTPSQAVAELRDTWIANVNNATTIAEVNTQKTNGIAAIQLQKAKEAAIAELNAEATDYPSEAAAGIVETYTGIINAATTTDAVNSAKEEGIQKLVEAKALQDAKTEAIAALNEAATTYPSDAADGIVETYTGIINAATTTDAVNSAKEEGIQALEDAYNAQGEIDRLAALDAVTVQQVADDDYSYLLENGVVFEIDGDNVNITVNGADEKEFTLSETDAITICPARTFTLTAIQDPANTSDYYATFYTSEGAYKVPETANAFIGTLLDDEHLMITNTGVIIHKSEAVLMKASRSDITLMPSCNKAAAAEGNDFIGTDKSKTLGASDFALSSGDKGIGFYNWEGKSIGDNEVYLTGNPDVEYIAIVLDGDTWVKITEQDDSTLTLYGVKKVEFFKENGTPAVRVTYKDNSTKTYTNPKKVDFGR